MLIESLLIDLLLFKNEKICVCQYFETGLSDAINKSFEIDLTLFPTAYFPTSPYLVPHSLNLV
jgi:hypothetical protein